MARTWIDPATGEKRYLRTFTDYNWRNYHLGIAIFVVGFAGLLVANGVSDKLGPSILGVLVILVGGSFSGACMIYGFILSRRDSRPRDRGAERIGEASRRGYL
jgi:hypothetical protein